jgi:hypothetical protein
MYVWFVHKGRKVGIRKTGGVGSKHTGSELLR